MKTKYTFLIVALVLLGGGFKLYNFIQNGSGPRDLMIQNDTSTANLQPEFDENKTIISSRYIHYSPEALEQTKTTRRVLYFYANWCPTCRPADASFSENSDMIPDDVTVIRVNYNDTETDGSEKELARKYGITYQHTFVQIGPNNEELAKWNGGDIDQLLSKIK